MLKHSHLLVTFTLAHRAIPANYKKPSTRPVRQVFLHVAKLAVGPPVIRTVLGHERPEPAGVIHLGKMADFVNKDVFHQFRR